MVGLSALCVCLHVYACVHVHVCLPAMFMCLLFKSVHVCSVFSLFCSSPQLCVIHHVTMVSVLLMTLASVLVDTVGLHAVSQVLLHQHIIPTLHLLA